MPVDFTLAEVCLAVGGKLTRDNDSSVKICGVACDSRDVKWGGLFVARRGENEDGHTYLESAAKNGAVAAIVDEAGLKSVKSPPSLSYIVVPDTSKALMDLARTWRRQLTAPVIAITGSFGKTTTKEICRTILAEVVGEGTANDKSFNNHVGLPLTLLRASREDKWIVLEAGMNHSGELDLLGSVCEPTVVVELGVGPVHLEHFGSVEEIAKAKCELLGHLRDGGTVVSAADDAILSRALKEKISGRNLSLTTFASTGAADLLLTKAETDSDGFAAGEFRLNDAQLKVTLRHRGTHNLRNAAAAMLAARAAFPLVPIEKWISALSKAEAPKMRLEMLEIGNLKIINDAYNANPVSMRAALATAADLARGVRLIAVLGDMRELGPTSAELHREIGREAAKSGADLLVGVGEMGAQLIAGAQIAGHKNAVVAPSIAAAVEAVLAATRDKKPALVLVKASRGMELEKVVEGIQNALLSAVSA